ncbi:MAG: N-6 DNA methylase [Phycisphaerae bacterium]|nr:N-6 DNA methylase [Phycisphaerae bacterium]
MSSIAEFNRVMEATDFYREGKPATSVLTRDELLDPRSDKHFKYKTAVEEGKIGAAAIFELSNAPCIYFKYLADAAPGDRQLTNIRRSAWNHGLAPMLWVVTPTAVRIYNCYSKPKTDDDKEHEQHLIRTFRDIAKNLEALNNFAGRLQLESGKFWRKDEAKKINRRQRVDRSLLHDLAEAEEELVEANLPIAAAHALLERCIFTAYLQDREILNPQFLMEQFGVKRFADVLNSEDKTSDLFAWISRTFNGDLFPLSSSEAKSRKPKHLEIVKRLLEGTSQSGQMRLWPYKFDVIPVELISSIYEMFTHSADGKTAKERSTHYTPISLVDIVLSEVFKRVPADGKTEVFRGVPADGKILDMACGSGVFLVESFRRLVSLRLAQGEELNRKMIREVLYDQIFGVDISKEAIQIAAFSLYLTLLELDPDPQPPNELKFKPLIGKNLFDSDAFDEEANYNRQEPFASKGFAAIVGNPPWTRTSSSSSNAKYCEKHGYAVARKGTPDQAFLWRVGDFASENTRIGLILHGKHFFSHDPKARRAKESLLSRFTPELLMNLADLRQAKLFPTSVAPALIFIGSGCQPEPGDSFTFVSVRRSEDFQNHGIINICPDNVKRLPTAKAASDPDMLKVASWGSARDMALIRHIRDSFPSLAEFVRQRPHGQGFKRSGERHKAPELKGKPLLAAGDMPQFKIDTKGLPTVKNIEFHRPRDPRIYKAPLVIATRGIGRKGFYSGLSLQDVVYDSLYYGFSLPEPEARFLNGIFNSLLATYYLFMTASIWGIERGEIQPIDLLRLPVPSFDESNPQAINAVADAIQKCEESIKSKLPERLRRRLNEAVFDLYGVDESETVLVEDLVNLTLDYRTKRFASHALKRPTSNDLSEYTEQVVDVIRPLLATRNQRAMVADVLDVGVSPLVIVKFRMVATGKTGQKVRTVNAAGLNDVLRQIEKQLKAKIIDRVYSQRVLRLYAGDDVYVVKPAELRYWSRSAALNDSDEILAEHLGAERGI